MGIIDRRKRDDRSLTNDQHYLKCLGARQNDLRLYDENACLFENIGSNALFSSNFNELCIHSDSNYNSLRNRPLGLCWLNWTHEGEETNPDHGNDRSISDESSADSSFISSLSLAVLYSTTDPSHVTLIVVYNLCPMQFLISRWPRSHFLIFYECGFTTDPCLILLWFIYK